jgi:formyl-CoA transferase
MEEGQSIFKRLVKSADVLIENFRPGTLEKWHLEYSELKAVNPGLIMIRITMFGQVGPYAHRPGFGTMAECMSGFASITGQSDGPPTLPPFGLADGVAAIYGAYSVMLALYHRDAKNGAGQMIDLAIYEPIMSLIGIQPTEFDQLGFIQKRTGNRSIHGAPRNTYHTLDDKWVAISAAPQRSALRVFEAIGKPELIEDDRFRDNQNRLRNVEALDTLIQAWIGSHNLSEVLDRFTACEATLAMVYDIKNIFDDPHFRERRSIIELEDVVLGKIRMQNVPVRFSDTPGVIQSTGPSLGENNHDVYVGELGMTEEMIDRLSKEKVI